MQIKLPLLVGALLSGTVILAQPAAHTHSGSNSSLRKVNLQPGQQFKVEHVMNSNSSMEMMGQAMDVKADASITSKVEVKAKNAGDYQLTATVTRMITNADMMGQSMNYDSDKPGDNDSEVGKILKDKINQPLNATLTGDGILTMQKNENAGGGAMNPISAMMGGAEDESNGLGDMFLLIPQQGKTGDNWSDSLVAKGAKTVRNYTIKSMQGDEAIVLISGTQSVSRTVENQGMEINVELNNKLSGEATVNTNTGLIRQRSLTIEGSGTTSVMGQSIPMNTKVTTQSTVSQL